MRRASIFFLFEVSLLTCGLPCLPHALARGLKAGHRGEQARPRLSGGAPWMVLSVRLRSTVTETGRDTPPALSGRLRVPRPTISRGRISTRASKVTYSTSREFNAPVLRQKICHLLCISQHEYTILSLQAGHSYRARQQNHPTLGYLGLFKETMMYLTE